MGTIVSPNKILLIWELSSEQPRPLQGRISGAAAATAAAAAAACWDVYRVGTSFELGASGPGA